MYLKDGFGSQEDDSQRRRDRPQETGGDEILAELGLAGVGRPRFDTSMLGISGESRSMRMGESSREGDERGDQIVSETETLVAQVLQSESIVGDEGDEAISLLTTLEDAIETANDRDELEMGLESWFEELLKANPYFRDLWNNIFLISPEELSRIFRDDVMKLYPDTVDIVKASRGSMSLVVQLNNQLKTVMEQDPEVLEAMSVMYMLTAVKADPKSSLCIREQTVGVLRKLAA